MLFCCEVPEEEVSQNKSGTRTEPHSHRTYSYLNLRFVLNELVTCSMRSVCENGLHTSSGLPVVLLLAADLEAVIEREGLVSVPVRQLYAQGVLSLAGQLVNVLIPQPVLCRRAPKALRWDKQWAGWKQLFWTDCRWFLAICLFSQNDKNLQTRGLRDGGREFLIYLLIYYYIRTALS